MLLQLPCRECAGSVCQRGVLAVGDDPALHACCQPTDTGPASGEYLRQLTAERERDKRAERERERERE